ncbi:Histidine triad (HIT) protein [Syntrophobacter sp. SbD1]|nr:Histidine triad (HIT) protein [Syntrophobacter sp. SbD1]
MRNLWAPWRVEYILGKKPHGCIFCREYHGQSDEQRLILYRDDLVMVMMNRFPYNNGHLLVCPWRHVSSLDELTADDEKGLMALVKRSTRILKKVMHPDGFNIGLNLGREAGAGYEEHLHFHIVPRWRGDTNFMIALADVRSIPEHIKQSYSKLLPHFGKESADEAV